MGLYVRDGRNSSHFGVAINGFSIMEVALTLFIGTILALGSGYMIVHTTKEGTRLQASDNTKSLTGEIHRRCLNSKNIVSACQFGNEVFTVTAAATMQGVPITLRLPQQGGTFLNIAAGAQTPFGRVNTMQLAQLQCQGQTTNGTEMASATLRLSMQTGPNQFTRENNLGRFLVELQVVNGTTPCSGSRQALQASVQNFNNVNSALCQQLGLVLDPSGTRCRLPVHNMKGQTNPGPCGADEYVSSIQPDPAGGGRAICSSFPVDRCHAGELADGMKNGLLECAVEPASTTVTVVPPTTAAPTTPAPTAYVPPAPTQVNLPTGTGTLPNTDPCPEAATYRNCVDAVNAGGNVQLGLTMADCGPAPVCYGGVTSQPTPTYSTPSTTPSITPAPLPTAVPIPPSNQCSCGGVFISPGSYCGYCYWEVDYEPMGFSSGRFVRSATYNYRSSGVLQCQNTGQLTATTGIAYQTGLGCEGRYVNW